MFRRQMYIQPSVEFGGLLAETSRDADDKEALKGSPVDSIFPLFGYQINPFYITVLLHNTM